MQTNEDEQILFSVQVNTPTIFETNFPHMQNVMGKACRYQMEVNAYKHHLQEHLLHNIMESAVVKRIISLIINLKALSKTLEELQVR